MKKQVLVTGGAGFIGRHLCEALLDQDCKVYCLDNFYTGTYRNIEPFQNHPCFESIEADVCDTPFLKVDRIFHLACPASPVHYQHAPLNTVRTAVMGTWRILDVAAHVGARVVLASTSEIYGDPEQHPQKESYWGHVNCYGPRACYDEGKRMGETLAYEYNAAGKADVRVARIFNTYGPYMRADDGRVVSNMVVQALTGQPVSVYGDGTQTRSFCYVDDLKRGLLKLMEANAVNGPVNLGNPQECTVMELLEKIQTYMSMDLDVVYRPLPQDDPRKRKPDISKAKDVLGWCPEVGLEQGLGETIAYFSKVLNISEKHDPACLKRAVGKL
jgi:UDP-glucuronate decarboxylase